MINFIKNIVVFIFITFLIYSLSRSLFDYKKKFSFFEEYKIEWQKQLDKNKKLKSEILKNQDYYTVEKNIRQKLNLLKPNEIAIILPKITATPSPTPEIKKASYEQWLELFF